MGKTLAEPEKVRLEKYSRFFPGPVTATNEPTRGETMLDLLLVNRDGVVGA